MTQRNSIEWTAARDARLLAIRSEDPDASCSQIADRLVAEGIPVTRKSVWNRLARLELEAKAAAPIAANGIQRIEAREINYLDRLAGLDAGDGELIVALGDTQFPYEEPTAWAITLSFLASAEVSHVVLTGDIIDAYQASRFEKDPRVMSIQDELNYAHTRLAELRAAVGPDARISWIPGNHEERFARLVMNQVPELVGLRRAGSAEELLSVPYLVNLEALGIDWVRQDGLGNDYHNGVLRLAPDLVATHGFYSRKGGGGSSILPLVDRWDCSVIGGHDHTAGIGLVTRGGVAGAPTRRLRAISTGMLCQRDLGYLPTATGNWQTGFATVTKFGDEAGQWHADLAEIDTERGELVWRGKRWTMPAAPAKGKGRKGVRRD